MYLLIEIVFQLSDVAHGPLVYKDYLQVQRLLVIAT